MSKTIKRYTKHLLAFNPVYDVFTNCTKCGNDKTIISKLVGGSTKIPAYFIKSYCPTCGGKFLPRDKRTYELTKPLKWRYSKKYNHSKINTYANRKTENVTA